MAKDKKAIEKRMISGELPPIVREISSNGWMTSDFDEQNKLPPISGVYMFIDVYEEIRTGKLNDRPLYIGIARSLKARHASHPIRKIIPITRACHVWYKPVSESNLFEKEQYLIQNFQPILNIRGVC
jgi:hypothetical protein